ncbi:MAG: outer membrane lipoprotein chaperone LolA [Burkholderiales bacterium]|nr:outer membrane lipoprotein chaperone LolA [Burkholderiales bacterium]MDR4518534.1 outer membrane lipoprotein chaperone LolA [Nitrosomonas sp.]
MNLTINRIVFFINAYLFVLLLMMPALAWSSAIENLKTFIQETQTVRANFTQTLLDKNARNIQKSKGTLEFERPDKFRWIYLEPYEQSIVGDGKQVWFYDHDLNQVTIRQFNIAIGSSPAALLAGNDTIEDNFELTNLGLQDEIEWMEAIPKSKDSAFEFIQLGFSLKGDLQYMALRDNFGQTTYLTFSDLTKNPSLTEGFFKFQPPDGADIISE